jgi:hypothetical protein
MDNLLTPLISFSRNFIDVARAPDPRDSLFFVTNTGILILCIMSTCSVQAILCFKLVSTKISVLLILTCPFLWSVQLYSAVRL